MKNDDLKNEICGGAPKGENYGPMQDKDNGGGKVQESMDARCLTDAKY